MDVSMPYEKMAREPSNCMVRATSANRKKRCLILYKANKLIQSLVMKGP